MGEGKGKGWRDVGGVGEENGVGQCVRGGGMGKGNGDGSVWKGMGVCGRGWECIKGGRLGEGDGLGGIHPRVIEVVLCTWETHTCLALCSPTSLGLSTYRLSHRLFRS